MHWAGGVLFARCATAFRDPAPDRGTVVIAGGRELVGAHGAFHLGVVAVALEHQVGDAPDVDLEYHPWKARRDPSINT
jgi:hypothetical protein